MALSLIQIVAKSESTTLELEHATGEPCEAEGAMTESAKEVEFHMTELVRPDTELLLYQAEDARARRARFGSTRPACATKEAQ